jgi:hypothetical protein
MKPEEQRIAIAEAVGCINVKMWGDSCIASLGIDNNGNCWGSYVVKDYLNDLNAMHEAEKILSDNNRMKFRGELVEMMRPKYGFESACLLAIHATAAQRAEAFLRTLGLWKE